MKKNTEHTRKERFPGRVAFLGNYVPRQCGIATFTHDLYRSFKARFPQVDSFVVSVEDRPDTYEYPVEVKYTFAQNDYAAYRQTARYLNESGAEIVCVQHEFGIYGGDAGSYLLDLLRHLRVPAVVTLHTILERPDANQFRVIEELADVAQSLVVMTERGKAMLQAIYDVPAEKIIVIPHGVPDIVFSNPDLHKAKFGLEGRKVVLTFGLLSPNKGIESAIEGIRAAVRQFPDLTYVVLGATHPNLIREQGEAYRESLQALVTKYQLEANVVFYNRFVEKDDLISYLQMADVYLTPYLNVAQITSGTLAYSFGCGKAVVSTPYWHAEELLSDGRGLLVPFNNGDAIGEALITLFSDDVLRQSLQREAYQTGRRMIWSEVATLYGQAFRRANQFETTEYRTELPDLRLDHLHRLTDSTGIAQHATYTFPNRNEGYCTDDNARAMMLSVRMESIDELIDARLPWLTDIYTAFVMHAFDPVSGRFRNFMSYGREWLEDVGSEDSNARAIWAIAESVAWSRRRDVRQSGADLLSRAIEPVTEFRSPRAWAFTLLGLSAYLKRYPGDRKKEAIRDILEQKLVHLWQVQSAPQWPWFEPVLSYDNARLPQALLESDRAECRKVGLEALEWLRLVQMNAVGQFQPIGSNGFYRRGEKRAYFDQQPIEAAASVSAYLTAYRLTGDATWREAAVMAYKWFLGANDAGRPLYDSVSGGCFDGLHSTRVNANQGAESCWAYLSARIEIASVWETVDEEDEAVESLREFQ